MRAILTYHSIDESGSVISVSPERFAGHVEWLASGAVKVVSVADLLGAEDGADAVAITFDDAFENFATQAWPLLRDARLPATMFVPTGFVGRTNEWDIMPGGAMPRLGLMDWATLARLVGEGLELGAHTRSHPDLRALDAGRLHDEIAGAVEDIVRETGRRATGFAYPYGYHDARVVAAVRNICAWACTTRLSPVKGRQDPYRLPRLDAYFLRGPGRLDRFRSPSFEWYMSLRAGIRRARRR